MSLNLGRSVKKVSIAKGDGSGVFVLHKAKSKKKKQSKNLQPMEKAMRSFTDANLASAKSLSEGHRKSNRKKRDGWLLDLPKNFFKANDKGSRKFS